MMKDLSIIIAGALSLFVLIFVIAVFAGTIVWALWPIAIPAAFPRLVEEGYLAAELSWIASVTLTWIMGILFHSVYSDKKE